MAIDDYIPAVVILIISILASLAIVYLPYFVEFGSGWYLLCLTTILAITNFGGIYILNKLIIIKIVK